MKATLYAVHMQNVWTWRATLHFEADLGFWLQQEGPAVEIVRLHPLISWGQAVYLQQLMNSRLGRYNIHHLNEVRGELIKGLAVLQASETLLQKLELSKLNYANEAAAAASFAFNDALSDLWTTAAIQGRSLLPHEWLDLRNQHGEESSVDLAAELQFAYLRGQLQLTQGVLSHERRKWWLRSSNVLTCSRCGGGVEHMRWMHCIFCEGPCPYCEQCLAMGRARFCSPLIRGKAVDLPITNELSDAAAAIYPKPLEQWSLNGAQMEAAQAGLAFLEQTGQASPQGESQQLFHESIIPANRQLPTKGELPCFLLWAVTGAGKTEMIFPLIEYELAQGRKVMIATPRKDVVLELAPRVQAAFPQHTLVILYGGSQQRWEQGDIILATTHQLLRFHQAFDLVILDELDAYPFHNNPMLEFAAQTACKPHGRFIFLSATPPIRLQKDAKRNRLPHIRIPVRFHQQPLTVPQLIAVKPLKQWFGKQPPMPQTFAKAGAMDLMPPIPFKLLKALQQSLDRGAQLFIFVPQIRLIAPLVLLLQAQFQDKVIEGTHSKDEERREKVVHFRQSQIDILVTTTILERGVTIAKTDVFVLDADSALFDEASLIQMAGRAGRSREDPEGYVYFLAYNRTKAQVNATRQIKKMNKLAKSKGYFGSKINE